MSFLLVDVVLEEVGETLKVGFVLLDVVVAGAFDPVKTFYRD